MKNPRIMAYALVAWALSLIAVDGNLATGAAGVDHVYEDAALDHLSPGLDWIRQEGLRLGYSYRADLDWYPLAADIGMNGIISRLEIANDPSGDELREADYPAGVNPPAALADWRMVRLSARAAKEHGIRFFYMLGFSYGHTYNDGFRDNPRRFNNGSRPSPTDDIFWSRVIENRFLRVAEALRGEEYQIDGFFIDSETYYEGGGSPPGDIDYGDFALADFLTASGKELDCADLTIEQRRARIDQLGWRDELRQFQFERIRDLAANTRRRVQAIHPDAFFGTFLWKHDLYFQGLAAGFATPRTPFWIGLEGGAYPGGFDEGLLAHLEDIRRVAGVPVLVSAGTALPGRLSPRYMSSLESAAAGNLYHRTINSGGGYWFWSLGRVSAGGQPFLDMLKLVNDELDKYYTSGRTYRSHLRPRPFPVEQPWNLAELYRAADWQTLPAEALPAAPPPSWGFASRGRDLAFAVPAAAGDNLEFLVRTHGLALYPSSTYAAFFNGDRVIDIQEPITVIERSRTITQTASADGAWIMAASGGPPVTDNAFSVLPQTRSAVVIPPDGVLTMFGFSSFGAQPFETSIFFYVPRDTRSFGIRLAGRAVLRLHDAEAAMVLEHRDGDMRLRRDVDDEEMGPLAQLDETGTATVEVAPGQAGRIWWVTVTEADWGSYSVALTGIPAVYAACPEQLLAPKL